MKIVRAERKQWKDIYLIESTLQRKPEAHWLRKTVAWIRPRVVTSNHDVGNNTVELTLLSQTFSLVKLSALLDFVSQGAFLFVNAAFVLNTGGYVWNNSLVENQQHRFNVLIKSQVCYQDEPWKDKVSHSRTYLDFSLSESTWCMRRKTNERQDNELHSTWPQRLHGSGLLILSYRPIILTLY